MCREGRFGRGEGASETTALSETSRAVRDAPSAPRLEGLWHHVGLGIDGGGVTRATAALDAHIRDTITRRPAT